MSSQVEKDPEVLDAATNKEDHIEAESSSTTQRDESAYENDVQEKAQENTQEPVAKIDSNAEEERVYVTGLPMMLLMTSLTMVVFLMLLDVSIIVTVTFPPLGLWWMSLNSGQRPFLASRQLSTLFQVGFKNRVSPTGSVYADFDPVQMLAGMAAPINLLGTAQSH